MTLPQSRVVVVANQPPFCYGWCLDSILVLILQDTMYIKLSVSAKQNKYVHEENRKLFCTYYAAFINPNKLWDNCCKWPFVIVHLFAVKQHSFPN